MRIRQVKPAFWTDARIAAMSPATRLFYIGLWMLADDAGWLRCDVPQIANELYGYESRKRRERDVQAFLDVLTSDGRLVIHPCGHAFVPKLTDHQHLSAGTKQVKTFQREHAECSGDHTPSRGNPPTPAETRASPAVNVKVKGKVNVNGKGTEREGKGKGSARPLAPDGADALPTESEFRRLTGLPSFMEKETA